MEDCCKCNDQCCECGNIEPIIPTDEELNEILDEMFYQYGVATSLDFKMTARECGFEMNQTKASMFLSEYAKEKDINYSIKYDDNGMAYRAYELPKFEEDDACACCHEDDRAKGCSDYDDILNDETIYDKPIIISERPINPHEINTFFGDVIDNQAVKIGKLDSSEEDLAKNLIDNKVSNNFFNEWKNITKLSEFDKEIAIMQIDTIIFKLNCLINYYMNKMLPLDELDTKVSDIISNLISTNNNLSIIDKKNARINENKKDIMNRCPLCESYNTNVTYGGGIFKTTHQFLTCNDCNHIETRELENK